MQIKEVRIGAVADSRKEKTIIISVNNCWTAAPSGKSIGKYEAKSYRPSIEKDINSLQNLQGLSGEDFQGINDLLKVEKLFRQKVGANTLFALEASILKAIAKEQKKELWQILGHKKIPKLVSNIIGGGAHSSGKKPDFQEFLVIGDKKSNTQAYKETDKFIKGKLKNDENAWKSSFTNEQALELLKWANMKIGIDAAASQFFSNKKYYYTNPRSFKTRQEQIEYIVDLIEDYGLNYVEDPLQQDDFKGFAEILKRTKGKCLIVGDDLTTTNFNRVKKAIETKSINGVIIKPNQIGSLLEVRKVIGLCKKNKIKAIMSHRSGETEDWTISDLAVGFGCDYLKIPVAGKERLAKVDRLEKIKHK